MIHSAQQMNEIFCWEQKFRICMILPMNDQNILERKGTTKKKEGIFRQI